MPDFDKAARYVAKQDPAGFLRWLWRNAATPLAFHSWLDTRRLALPAEGDLTCDTVAGLGTVADVKPTAGLIVEFQAESRRDVLDRLLAYVVRLWQEPPKELVETKAWVVAGAVVNLTGPPQSDSVNLCILGVPECGLRFQILQRTLREEDANATLTEILAGRTTLWLLPWIPLMHGGSESAILKRWKRAASTERDRLVRSTLAGLTVVFAELTGSAKTWRQAFRGWNVQKSKLMEEMRDEGRLETRRADLLLLLRKRFKTLPKDLVKRIEMATDVQKLGNCIDQIFDITSPSELKL